MTRTTYTESELTAKSLSIGRIVAGSPTRRSSARSHLDEFVDTVAAATRTARPGRVRFRDHAVAVGDLPAVLAVEFVTCHLDVLVAVPARAGPAPDISEFVATPDGGPGSGPVLKGSVSFAFAGTTKAHVSASTGPPLFPRVDGGAGAPRSPQEPLVPLA
jgi:hypothetical protein